MIHRTTLLALVLICIACLAGAAVAPAPSPAAPPAPAAVAPAAAAPAPAWLQPTANSSVEKPTASQRPGTQAPLGAIFKSACSQGCLSDEIACFNGCGGDHDCNVNCNNDYYCCLRTCDPNGPQCF